MNNILVSVIVPVYNASRYLDKCLNSILNQTHTNIEIVLIDDGSVDNSYSICEKYACKDNRIILFHQKNSGVSSARNKGLSICKGQYLVFVDSDDWIETNYVEVLLRNAIAYDVDVSCSAMCRDNGIETKVIHNFDDKVITRLEALDNKSPYYLTGIGGKMFSRNCFENTRFREDIRMSEDTFLYLQIINSVNRVSWTAAPIYHYYKNENSATHSKNPNLYFDDFVVRRDLLEMYESYPSLYPKAFERSLKAAIKVIILSIFYNLSKEKKKIVKNWMILNRKEALSQNDLNVIQKIIFALACFI